MTIVLVYYYGIDYFLMLVCLYIFQVSHAKINPLRIVSVGPDLDFVAPHGREFLQQNWKKANISWIACASVLHLKVKDLDIIDYSTVKLRWLPRVSI